jgi:SAM-dependent methyltransferase
MDSIDGSAALPMPGFPPSELQAGFIGSSNRDALHEAWTFYLLMADQRRRHGLALGKGTDVLDFGCGWGRFTRMFLRDVPEGNIWYADSQTLALDVCRETRVPGRMILLQQMPPSDLPSARFDTSFAYSVFSHLSPKAHAAWEEEFARIMKPGGLVFITTQPRWFVDACRTLRENPGERVSRWHELLAESFVDYDDSLSRYDGGEFLYAGTGGGPTLPGEFYGQAVVPRGYFERQWGQHFELLDFIADAERCPQAVAVLRRRG